VIPLTSQSLAADIELANLQFDNRRFPVVIGGGYETQFHAGQYNSTWVTHPSGVPNAPDAVVVDLCWSATDIASRVLPDGRFSAPDPAAPPLQPSLLQLRRDRLESKQPPEDAVSSAEFAKFIAACAEMYAPMETLQAVNLPLFVLPSDETLESRNAQMAPCSLGAVLAGCIKTAMGAECGLLPAAFLCCNAAYSHCFGYADLLREVNRLASPPVLCPVVTVRLPGQVLQEAIAFSRQFPGAAFLHTDNRLIVSSPQPGAEGACECVAVNGEPFNPSREYTVALPRALLLTGGSPIVLPLSDLMEEAPELLPPPINARELTQLVLSLFAGGVWTRLDTFAALRRERPSLEAHAVGSVYEQLRVDSKEKSADDKEAERSREQEIVVEIVRQMVGAERTTQVDPTLASLMETLERNEYEHASASAAQLVSLHEGVGEDGTQASASDDNEN
jgi:hypothetical protein